MQLQLIGPRYVTPNPVEEGARLRFKKFVFTHGHARNMPVGRTMPEEPFPRMKLAVTTTNWWAQHEVWQPNTDIPGPIITAPDALLYLEWLNRLTPQSDGKPVMRHTIALKLTKDTTHEMLKLAKEAGFYIVKIYPDGVTTNSEGGWQLLTDLYPAIEAAAKLDFIIMLHGEEPGEYIDTYAREDRFMMQSFKKLVEDFPGVQIDVQHMSRKPTLEMVGEMPKNVTGGITIHHPILTRNDVLEWMGEKRRGLNPNNHCRPPAQTFEDRDALLYAILHADESQYEKFHLGPDSAPWNEWDKYCSCGCAGVCSSPTAGPVVVELFEKNDRLNHPAFEAFTVRNGARRFKVKVNEDAYFELEKGDWTIPEKYGNVVPFWAGRKIGWRPIEPAALNPILLLVV